MTTTHRNRASGAGSARQAPSVGHATAAAKGSVQTNANDGGSVGVPPCQAGSPCSRTRVGAAVRGSSAWRSRLCCARAWPTTWSML